jgi:hypothetical protein
MKTKGFFALGAVGWTLVTLLACGDSGSAGGTSSGGISSGASGTSGCPANADCTPPGASSSSGGTSSSSGMTSSSGSSGAMSSGGVDGGADTGATDCGSNMDCGVDFVCLKLDPSKCPERGLCVSAKDCSDTTGTQYVQCSAGGTGQCFTKCQIVNMLVSSGHGSAVTAGYKGSGGLCAI